MEVRRRRRRRSLSIARGEAASGSRAADGRSSSDAARSRRPFGRFPDIAPTIVGAFACIRARPHSDRSDHPMTNGGPNQPRPTRNERREAAREKARVLREEQKKRERRNKVLIQVGVIVAVVAIAALIGGADLQQHQAGGARSRRTWRATASCSSPATTAASCAVETPGARRRAATPTPTVPDDSGTVANIVIVHRLPLPVLRPVRGDELRRAAHDGRVRAPRPSRCTRSRS